MDELLVRYSNVPPRIRYSAGAGIIVLMLLVQTFWIHASQRDQQAELDAKLSKLQSERNEKSTYAENLPRYEARLLELQTSLNTARVLLPDNPDVPQFLAQLGNNGRDVGLVIERIEPKEETYADFYAELAFGVQVHGTYHEIAQFIDSVNKFDRIVNVSDISMVEPHPESQKVIVKGALKIKTYRFLSDEQAAAVAKAKKEKK